MAYQTRGRDPLLDSTTQAVIEKRSKELLGIGLVALGVLVAMMIGSYSPDDPNWMLASDAPVQNWLGRFGASLAQPLFMIGGAATWGIALTLVVWGLRLALHYGEDRFVGRIIFAPIAIAIAAIYAATLPTSSAWPHSFGVGGFFGDTVLSVLLTLLPIGVEFAIRLFSLIFGVAMLAMGAFVLGFTKDEIIRGWKLFLIGLIMAYDLVVRLMGRSAQASFVVARSVQNRVQDGIDARRTNMAQRQTEQAEAMPRDYVMPEDAPRRPAAVVRPAPPVSGHPAERSQPAASPAMPPLPEPPLTAAHRPAVAPAAAHSNSFAAPPRPEPAPAGGLFSRMPSLLRRADPDPARMPQPELVDNAPWSGDAGPVDGDRIKSRIADAIRARKRSAEEADAMPVEPVVTRPKRPMPLILQTNPAPQEPVMQAPQTPDLIDDGDFGLSMDWTETPAAYADVPAQPVVSASVAPVVPPAPQAAAPRKAVVQHNPKRSIAPSSRARAEAQPALPLEDRFAGYEQPPLSLLSDPSNVERHVLSDDALEENARMLESVLDDYGVKGEIVSVRPGPVVTMYELEPAPGLKASRVIGLADDIARSMSALSARVSTVPGRSVIGIELPNDHREMVPLREILAARDFGDSQMRLPLALGKDIGGQPIIANLAKMPHLLIAGTTGSGKSVAINTMILSLLYKLTPEECRLIMIDPKMLELSVYDGIPHLLSPVVTDPKKAVVALKWVVGEMEERYRKMSKMGVRNIEGYNGRVRDALARGETFERTVQTGFDEETGDPIFESEEIQPEVLPFIVVIVDEMADLMMVAGKEIEACIQRLAQMARASGIHLIMATQRPSVDVITGTIKANFPTRISFQVTSKIDSRTILGEMGAEQLLGQGDMLYMAGGSRITRVHGPFCSDEEVEEIVNFLKGFGPPEYVSGVVEGPPEDSEANIDAVLGLGGNTDGEDALYDQAVQIVARDRKCSTSYIQRKLAIGYNKAARLVEQMEDNGVVSSANHVGKREVLVPEVH
ncbi:DNA translocase FtsK 4TM domain-containing protein [Ponticoccus sp. SC2-23]|uniref:DNA translocase FtsK n=1 Tax=Alexandriicola marinus TaxID=2081710 RepID=UPI000FDBA0EA|nr:DNA translocase FtsK [Alexandriicola marinus]MBM1220562.1 DNA translocase FtsK 4TM domain-containing protein [Ponticoccus sp. SC6-9]MBM1225248.1 DNA translocase FtsK 4TM domain-containing protein [Ponticoccus sp. SC6-15]MBM1228762.1 DNA translocase FtsK 4TM domain-containing protein [Ponticoccus sp. SC6-38]MBM1233601.1 DNA translocase FtsK 4TM domain-containing protein [Ponticoccus sp. SC6-45]MBM1239263.1 DNA translocase FtsK 4TM domain-containing protein [Ponticoccus sp. SC6-49]MBM1243045